MIRVRTLVAATVTAVLVIHCAPGRERVDVQRAAVLSDIESKIKSAAPAVGETFGAAIAASGNTLVVGAYGHSEGTSIQLGAAYVLVRDATSGTWSHQAKLLPADTTANYQYFGRAVAISGDLVAVGTPQRDAVRIFVRSGTTWSQEVKLTGASGFGHALALSGSTLAVSAYGAIGSVLVYTRTAPGTWSLQQTLAPTASGNTYFGAAVALSGDTLVVGAPYETTVAPPFAGGGAAYIYARSGSTWMQQARLAATLTLPAQFGAAVALAGDTAAIGAPFYSEGPPYNRGSAYVFARSGIAWSQQAQLSPVEARAQDDHFGESVALLGDTVVCGSPEHDTGGASNRGAAYVFDRTGSSWSPSTRLVASDGTSDDTFGRAVALGPSYAAIGAPGRGQDSLAGAGAAFVYHPIPTRPNGTTCTKNGECTTDHCIDGYCCDTGCTDACKACDTPTALGTCSAIVDGAPPAGKVCSPGIRCVAGACSTGCSGQADCATSFFCDAGTCAARRAKGDNCADARACISALCVDGICCDRACSGQCEACDVAGAAGTCSPVFGAPHGARAACAGTGSGTVCGPSCNGVDPTQCNPAPVTTPCAINACNAGVETHANLCDGAGSCRDVPKSCGVYACSASACRTTCTSKADCAPGHWCNNGICEGAIDLGAPCTSGSSCSTDLCTDGVCCAVATCGAGGTCAGPTKKGTCTKSLGESCAHGDECGAGLCVDGLCCDAACGGQCEACDVGGKRGTCSPVGGAPHGARAACDAGGTDLCAVRACDGNQDRAACVGFRHGPSTLCEPARCTEGGLVPAASCDGAGKCKTTAAVSCAPFGCDAASLECRAMCRTSGDCARGFTCASSRCVQGATCSDDGIASIAPDGVETRCAPYRCGADGVCEKACTFSTQCASGAVCDVVAHACVNAVPAPADDGGSCSTTAAGRASGHAFFLSLLALACANRRRAIPPGSASVRELQNP